MIKRCTGCGVKLQAQDKEKIGYVNSKVYETSFYCERCFKIKNYGEALCVTKKIDYNRMIKEIDKTKSLVVFLIDALNISDESIEYFKNINANKILVLTKKDLLPKSVKDKKIIEYFNSEFGILDDIICISSIKHKNIDQMLKLFKKYNKKNIYLIGKTNCGKSTFLNAICKSLGTISSVVTSPIPNTTLDFIYLDINNFTFIDTPGFITENSIYNFLKPKEIKRINPKKEIKVKTIQIKEGFCIIIDDVLRIDYVKGENNSLSFYMNNYLNYNKMKIITSDKLKMLPKLQFDIKGNVDIVINGLGFIKVSKKGCFVVYTLDEKLISKRRSLI